jgi:DNA-binding GntR family transcriptional regulator
LLRDPGDLETACEFYWQMKERAELLKLAARVDAMSVQPDRFLYLGLHEKLHRRIAECARCPALSEAIEKTHALASTWFCVTRAPSAHPPHHHQDLMNTWSRRIPMLPQKPCAST